MSIIRRCAETVLRCVAVIFFIAAAYHTRHTWIPSGSDHVADRLPQLVRDVNWTKNYATVVMVLSGQRPQSPDDELFYRQIARQCRRGIHCLSVFPAQPARVPAEFRGLLKQMLIDVQDVVSVDPMAIGVSVTPSVFIVDSAGREIGAWKGPISADAQHAIRRQIEDIALERVVKDGCQTRRGLRIGRIRPRAFVSSIHGRALLSVPFISGEP